MHLTKRPRISDGYFVDVNGGKHPRFREYECDTCGQVCTFDVERNFWIQGTVE